MGSTSRKATWLSSSSSLVNTMFSIVLLIVCNRFSISFVFTMANTSSDMSFPKTDVTVTVNGFLFEVLQYRFCEETGK